MLLINLVIWIIVSLVFVCVKCGENPPNILFILADDLGYNDISWHNPDIISPNLDKLAKEGVILENNYVQSTCSPSRSALLTGYYPIHTGNQHRPILTQEPVGLYTNFTLMPQYFKRLGYDTHALGKWHLGFCNEKYLPTNRGFDTFYGFYSGMEDYYSHDYPASVGGGKNGYDLRDQKLPDTSVKGNYSTDIFAKRAMKILNNYASKNSSNPFFIYLAFQSVHSPLQVPLKYEKMYANNSNKARRIFSGMVTAMDDAIGKVIDVLQKNQDVYDNTIIVFTTDNGGEVLNGGNNFPLRGDKVTLWEGGIRASSFIHAPKLLKPRVSNKLMHITDWLPTLLAAAQDVSGKVECLNAGEIDGVNQWEVLKNEALDITARSEMLINIDPLLDNGAIRVGCMKLIVGNPGTPSGWIPPVQVIDLSFEQALHLKKNDMFSNSECFDNVTIRLFNICSDPTELFNIADRHPDIVESLLKRLNHSKLGMIKPFIKSKEVVEGNPNNFDGFFSSGWCNANI